MVRPNSFLAQCVCTLDTTCVCVCVCVPLCGFEHSEAEQLADPVCVYVGHRVHQMCLVLPEQVDGLGLRLPERLLELQEDLVVGAEAHPLDGVQLMEGWSRAQQGGMVLLHVPWTWS